MSQTPSRGLAVVFVLFTLLGVVSWSDSLVYLVWFGCLYVCLLGCLLACLLCISWLGFAFPVCCLACLCVLLFGCNLASFFFVCWCCFATSPAPEMKRMWTWWPTDFNRCTALLRSRSLPPLPFGSDDRLKGTNDGDFYSNKKPSHENSMSLIFPDHIWSHHEGAVFNKILHDSLWMFDMYSKIATRDTSDHHQIHHQSQQLLHTRCLPSLNALAQEHSRKSRNPIYSARHAWQEFRAWGRGRYTWAACWLSMICFNVSAVLAQFVEKTRSNPIRSL